jgi:AcrR family transcriptional regulator
MGVIERRAREREVRRESAIDAAMKIYEEEGYHAITMDKIAQRSELSRAALYLYFKNKEEILVSAIVAHAEYFAEVLKEVYDNRENAKDQLLEKLWECFQKFYEKDPTSFTAWQYLHQSDVIGNLSPELRDILHESGAKVVSLQHKIVEYAVAQNVFVDCDHRALAEVLWSTFLGIAYIEHSKAVLSRTSHLDRTREVARRVLAEGVLKRSRKAEETGHPPCQEL